LSKKQSKIEFILTINAILPLFISLSLSLILDFQEELFFSVACLIITKKKLFSLSLSLFPDYRMANLPGL